jgi:potassium channel subfamily K, other eukaryote
MNDPGLDEPIADAEAAAKEKIEDSPPSAHHNAQQDGSQAQQTNPGQNPYFDSSSPQDLEETYDKMGEEEQERNFLMPARWWYASTGIPLVAGTFGPMANAFSICALVENWRVRIPPGGTEEHGIDIRDPRWLIAVNAVSLAFALIANASLLLNMARRVSFRVAQPITILGFWIASVLLIGLVSYASSSTKFHKDVPNQALTQAYYYGIFAAGLYQIISYLMCVTVYGAYKGHYSKEFKLTVAQRTLMLQTIAFLVYLLLGALVYSHIEAWKFLDAVYWADFTLLTIGIGDDYTPETHLGRGLLFPFAMGGIIILGLVVGSIRSMILERGKKKLAARLTEKARVKLLKEVDKFRKRRSLGKPKGVMGLGRQTTKILAVEPGKGDMTELERREAEFEAMRKVQDWAALQRRYMSLGVSTFAFAFLVRVNRPRIVLKVLTWTVDDWSAGL